MIIFGTSTFSKLMKWYLEHDSGKGRPEAFTVEKEFVTSREFCGIPVIPFEELEDVFTKERISILNTCGYHDMNDVRKKVFDMCKNKGYAIHNYVHSSAILNGLEAGEGTIILEHVLFEPFVKIGNGNIFAPDVLIGHDSVIGDFNYFSGGIKVCGGCSIGNHNFIGTNAVLKEHLTIDDYNLIGAGTYLNADLEGYMVTAPVPCRIKHMSKENLDRLMNR